MNKELGNYNALEANIKEIETLSDFLPDTSSKEGYLKSKSISKQGRKIWNAIDKTRKQLGSDARKMVENINTEGKLYLAKIDEAIGPHTEAYKEHDEEIARVAEEKEKAFTAKIEVFAMPLNAHSMSADEIHVVIDAMKMHSLDGFYDRTIEAGRKRESTVNQLNEIKASKIVQEAEAANLAAERAEMERQQEELRKSQTIIAEANRIEREKMEAAQAEIDESNRKAQAEIDEKNRIERESIERENAAIEEAKRIAQAEEAAALRERQRIEQEAEVQRIHDEKKSANKAHIKRINNEALACFVSETFSQDAAKEIIELIAKGKIKNISINY